jgi:L-ascorbate metabolism protein UlaG (beta-lactamase superfamily)
MASHGVRPILVTAFVSLSCLWVTAAAAAPGTAEPPPPAAAADAARLLARVLHLSENDVRLRTARGVGVAVDPMVGAEELRARKVQLPDPSLILVTHAHGDHYNIAVLRDYARRNPGVVVAAPPDVARYAAASGVAVMEVAPGREYTLAGVAFRTVPAYHAEGVEHPLEKGWVGFVVRIDAATYYVTGDTQPLPEMAGLKPDVLLTPVFGCGSNIELALEMVRLCAPRVVVPLHSGGHGDVIARFLAGLPRDVTGAHYEEARLILGRSPAGG